MPPERVELLQSRRLLLPPELRDDPAYDDEMWEGRTGGDNIVGKETRNDTDDYAAPLAYE